MTEQPWQTPRPRIFDGAPAAGAVRDGKPHGVVRTASRRPAAHWLAGCVRVREHVPQRGLDVLLRCVRQSRASWAAPGTRWRRCSVRKLFDFVGILGLHRPRPGPTHLGSAAPAARWRVPLAPGAHGAATLRNRCAETRGPVRRTAASEDVLKACAMFRMDPIG